MVGVVSMTVPLYIGEVAPTHLRGSLGAANQFAVTIGILASYVVGIMVEKKQETLITCIPGEADGK
jgi:MFS transporter, SP family, ERD6-like sugar transporter